MIEIVISYVYQECHKKICFLAHLCFHVDVLDIGSISGLEG